MAVVSDKLPPLRHSLDLRSMLVPHPPAGGCDFFGHHSSRSVAGASGAERALSSLGPTGFGRWQRASGAESCCLVPCASGARTCCLSPRAHRALRLKICSGGGGMSRIPPRPLDPHPTLPATFQQVRPGGRVPSVDTPRDPKAPAYATPVHRRSHEQSAVAQGPKSPGRRRTTPSIFHRPSHCGSRTAARSLVCRTGSDLRTADWPPACGRGNPSTPGRGSAKGWSSSARREARKCLPSR